MYEAKNAIERRLGIPEFVEEYLLRHNIAVRLSARSRFPKWYQFLDSIGIDIESL